MSASLKMIPLCQLQPAKINVRKTGRDAGLEELAASIEAHGLLENLLVSKAAPKGEEPRYDVAAGGRRLAALRLLARRKKIARDHPVPCQLRTGDALTELSLAENIMRAPLHPADQYDAFAALKAEGLPVEDIAARFGLTPTVVQQRLKLAAVSPRLIAEYRKDAMTLEQLMAFAISDDHAAQEAVWFENPYAEVSAHSIRRLLTRSHVDGRDRRARFIGAKVYEAAGGIIIRDLFDTEDQGYFTDSQLLDRLGAERLEADAVALREEGWSWVEVWPEADFERLNHFGRAKTIAVKLSKKDEKRLTRLGERYDELVTALEDDGEEEASAELDRVSEELQALQARTMAWADDAKAEAGVIIFLDSAGHPSVERGLIRPEDGKPEPRKSKQAAAEPCAETTGYSEALLADLSAHRTAALRELLATQPDKALAALLEVLVRVVFFDAYPERCLKIAPSLTDPGRYSKSVGESKAAASFSERHAQWQGRLPAAEMLCSWLEGLGEADRHALLAHCVAATLDCVVRRGNERAADDGNHLAEALGLDMADWWRPTEANFLGQVTKAEIVRAVSEGVSALEGRRLTDLKKHEMAARAETLLASSRWLPTPLCSPSSASRPAGELKAAE